MAQEGASCSIHSVQLKRLAKSLFKNAKSAFGLIKKRAPAPSCPAKLRNQNANPGWSLLKDEEEITSRSEGFGFKLTTGLPGTNKTKGENTQNKGENEALSSHLSPFPTPGVPQKEQRGSATPCSGFLMFLWQQNRGFAVLSSLQNPARFFPRRFTNFRPL